MPQFTSLTAIAAPLPMPNVNTDMIIRVEALMYVPKGELGREGLAAFLEKRRASWRVD